MALTKRSVQAGRAGEPCKAALMSRSISASARVIGEAAVAAERAEDGADELDLALAIAPRIGTPRPGAAARRRGPRRRVPAQGERRPGSRAPSAPGEDADQKIELGLGRHPAVLTRSGETSQCRLLGGHVSGRARAGGRGNRLSASTKKSRQAGPCTGQAVLMARSCSASCCSIVPSSRSDWLSRSTSRLLDAAAADDLFDGVRRQNSHATSPPTAQLPWRAKVGHQSLPSG